MVGRRTVAVYAFLAISVLAAAGFNVGRVTYADVQQTVDQAWGSLPSNLVSRVIDGDTIELVDGTRVRYIGIDTPELNSSQGGPECLALEAKKANASMVEGKSVVLEYDLQKTDKYSRDLAYVYVDGSMINERLASDGYAQIMTIAPNVKYADRFLAAEQMARQAAKGLWSDAACPD